MRKVKVNNGVYAAQHSIRSIKFGPNSQFNLVCLSVCLLFSCSFGNYLPNASIFIESTCFSNHEFKCFLSFVVICICICIESFQFGSVRAILFEWIFNWFDGVLIFRFLLHFHRSLHSLTLLLHDLSESILCTEFQFRMVMRGIFIFTVIPVWCALRNAFACVAIDSSFHVNAQPSAYIHFNFQKLLCMFPSWLFSIIV